MISAISLEDKVKEINGKAFHPVDVARVNDQIIRMALFRGEYHWHAHANEDEFFYVIKGRMTIQIKDHPDINLREGQIAVVPKGIEHCPISSDDTYVLMVEPANLQSKGD
jgi:mannose-6-phosphate isomerase-like protein (cupin superfamily)